MSIERIRSSLKKDDLNTFDKVLSSYNMEPNISHDVIDFIDSKNFIIKASFSSCPKTGLISFENGTIANISCY